jgi:4-amino-4-deoxy-L-arabinose transferase-like glycosyltransferase
MSQQRDRTCQLLALLLLAFVLLATVYSLVVPLGEAPDEVPHFTYVRYIGQHGRLPTTTEEHEAFQPPLYYALGAAVSFWVEDLPAAPFAVRTNAYWDPVEPAAPKNLLLHTAAESWPFRGWALAWHLVRLVSIALGAVTVWAIYHLGRVLFPQKPAIGLAMAALTAFTPQFLFLSGVVNNDNAATAVSALILWRVAALVREGDGARIRRQSLVLGLLLGLGVLSKASLMALVPIAGLAMVVAEVRRAGWRAGLRSVLVSGLLAGGAMLLVSGWYFYRNWRLYGDPLGWSFLLQVNAPRQGPLTAEVLVWLFKGTFRSFWLGWIGIAFDEIVYWILAAVCLVGLAGFVAWLVRRGSSLDGGQRWALGLLGLHLAFTLASLLQWTATVLGTDQGRLIYPVLPTVMLILVAGWAWWVRGRWQNGLLAGLVAGMFLLALVTPGRSIAPVHAPAPVASQAELAAATRLDVDWGDLRLLGYRLEGNEVLPGGSLVLDLYWQGLKAMDDDWMTLIQLVDDQGVFVMYRDGSPTAGRDTTDRWQPGLPLASRHLLPIPDYAQPGDYYLTISVHPFGQQTWLPAVAPDGTPLGERFQLPVVVRIVAP